MPKGIPGSKAPHGTLSRYTRHRCRCEPCREARREWARKKYGRRSWAEHVSSLPPVEHGTETRYNYYRCRCEACKRAAADGKKRRRHANREAANAYDREYKRRRRAAA